LSVYFSYTLLYISVFKKEIKEDMLAQN